MNVKKSLRVRVLTLMMVTVMIASFLLTQTAAAFNVGGVTVNGTGSVLGATVTDVTGKVENDITDDLDPSAMNELPASVNGSDEISVIVKLNVPSISDVYTQKSTHYSIGEFAKTASADKVREDIEAAKAKVLKKLSRANIDYKLGYDYDMVITGFEVIVTANQFASLEKAIKGTATAIVSEVYEECVVTESSVGGAQLVENEVNVYDTGIFNSSNSKYDGSGTTIAVLDTGYDYTHTAYSVENFTSTNLAMTKESVAGVLSATKAYGFTEGLTADDVYMNAKIPYAYDYADKDADVYPIQSEHGTHVASIISGKNDVITGVAPNAQLVLMKVFSDLEQGAKTSWILAALQDCVALEVDVINMSLGTSSGFSRQSDKAEVEAVYDKLHEIGVSVVAAASNDYNSTMGSAKNGNLGLTSNPDSATVGSPSTYEGSLSVASISGVKTPYLLDKDGNIIYFVEANDASAEPKHFVDEILNANETERVFEYVTSPGVGRSADYTGLDVVGKIALVRRGSNTFEEKAQIAQRKGAAGVVIYNNVSGDISMTIGR
ncbi:MAG: S8 family serine peptidase, partial [Clostridia bacterium]|nr:S8 family serine peptidase [Clostridia bacterium]